MNYFEKIYTAVANREFNLLSNYLAVVSIDVRSRSLVTVAEKFASEGQLATSLQLHKEYGANVSYIVRGAAYGGDFNFALDLHKKYGVNASYIAQGAACGGHFDFALKLHKEYGANVDDMAQGAACGGHFDFALKLYEEYGANIDNIVQGAAFCGQFDFALKLHKEYDVDVNYIARCAIWGGYFDFALKLHKEHGANLNDIVQELTLDGYVYNTVSAMHYLLCIENAKDRSTLINAFKNSSEINEIVKQSLAGLAKKIENIYRFKNRYSLDRHQALFLHQHPAISVLMIQCYAPLMTKRCKKMPNGLPKEIFFICFSFWRQFV